MGTEESNVKKTKRYDFLGHFDCHRCGQEFGARESLNVILCKKRETGKIIIFFNILNVCIVKVFPTHEAFDNYVHQMHQRRQKDLEQCTSTVNFKHSFIMIVAGPTRPSKTTWIARLIQNRQDKLNLHHPELFGVICTGNLCTAT